RQSKRRRPAPGQGTAGRQSFLWEGTLTDQTTRTPDATREFSIPASPVMPFSVATRVYEPPPVGSAETDVPPLPLSAKWTKPVAVLDVFPFRFALMSRPSPVVAVVSKSVIVAVFPAPGVAVILK